MKHLHNLSLYMAVALMAILGYSCSKDSDEEKRLENEAQGVISNSNITMTSEPLWQRDLFPIMLGVSDYPQTFALTSKVGLNNVDWDFANRVIGGMVGTPIFPTKMTIDTKYDEAGLYSLIIFEPHKVFLTALGATLKIYPFEDMVALMPWPLYIDEVNRIVDGESIPLTKEEIEKFQIKNLDESTIQIIFPENHTSNFVVIEMKVSCHDEVIENPTPDAQKPRATGWKFIQFP